MKAHSRRSSSFVWGATFAVLFLVAGSAHAQLMGGRGQRHRAEDGVRQRVRRWPRTPPTPSSCSRSATPSERGCSPLAAPTVAPPGSIRTRPTRRSPTGIRGRVPPRAAIPASRGIPSGTCSSHTSTRTPPRWRFSSAPTEVPRSRTWSPSRAAWTNRPWSWPNTTAAGAPVAVWLVWNQSGAMVGRGAPVTGLGAVGAFVPLTSTGSSGCSFGDVAIAPSGAVVQVCTPSGGQTGGNINVWVDADGLGPGGWAGPVVAGTTLVGGFDFIPAQNTRSVDPETGLVFDANPASPHFGRLYLMYTDETVQENNDRTSCSGSPTTTATTWSSPPIRVNDDPGLPTIRSQFNPKISIDDPTGNFMVCWHDCRESADQHRHARVLHGGGTAGRLARRSCRTCRSATACRREQRWLRLRRLLRVGLLQRRRPPGLARHVQQHRQQPTDLNFDAQTDRVTGNVPVELLQFRVE